MMAAEKKRTDRMAEDANEGMAMNGVRMCKMTPLGVNELKGVLTTVRDAICHSRKTMSKIIQ